LSIKDDFNVHSIPTKQAKPWILKKHYAGRVPSVSYAFGLHRGKELVGVCTFGKPASNALCKGICGKKYADKVIELNRLITEDDLPKNSTSYFVSQSLKKITKPKIIVSYADRSQGHHGYIYQATNWIYTGLSDKHIKWEIKGKENKHCRHIFDEYGGVEKAKEKLGNKIIKKERPRKHRYVYFLGNKKWKKMMKKKLKYKQKPYPKGDNKEYDTGDKLAKQQRLF